jgi:serine/threonine protein kinase/tetratricopeptide (TPR) repeat protein
MIGQKIQQFQITEKLGEGGMGVVYKAEDTRLERTVALKFLSTQVTERPGEQERLVEEARAAAGLQHPNICTIYEINEYDDQTFIVMSYIDGVTLRDKVLSSPIGVDEALRIVLQLGQGLEQAHGKGLIHRDIKSANVMVDAEGRAFIMDFGLARRHDEVKPDDPLSSGGTSAYMSPEQASGRGVDQRTDIWSLGVVLYEMLAGELPFRGDYEQAVRYSIVNEDPKPLEKLRPGVPEEVRAVIDKCMEKDPDDRYQTIGDLVTELKAVIDNRRRGQRPSRAQGRPRAVSIPVAALVVLIAAFLAYDLFVGEEAGSEVRIPIAVIDFDNETDNPALDGLSGMLITSLEQSRRLSVMTRTRMFDVLKIMGRDDVDRIDESLGQELCRQAGVGALVIPTIHKFGNKYTIDLKVLDTRRSEYIFTTKEEGEGEESIPGMIDEIARNIRIDLQEESHEIEQNTQSVADMTTVSLEAYKHYFEGERLLDALNFKGAAGEFEQAVALDSTFALAHYRLAYTQWWSRHQLDAAADHVHAAMAMIDRIPLKEQLLVKALNASLEDGFAAQMPYLREMQQIYPHNKEMLFGIGDISFHTENYDTAQVYFEKVLEMDPKFERALQHLTWTYLRTDQPQQGYDIAQVWVDQAKSPESLQYLGEAAFLLGRSEEAISWFEKAREMSDEKEWATMALARAYLQSEQPGQAEAELTGILESDAGIKTKVSVYGALAMNVLPYMGRYHDALQMLDAGLDSVATGGKPQMAALLNSWRASLLFWGWRDYDAIAETWAVVDAYPDSIKGPDVWINRGVHKILAGDVDAGLAMVLKHNKEKMAIPLFESLAMAQRGDCDGAIAAMDSIVGIPENNMTGVRMRAALCYYDSGQWEAAAEQFAIIADNRLIDFNNTLIIPFSHYFLAKSLEQTGEASRALASYRRFLEIWQYADEDQTVLGDARARVAALEAAGSM